MHVIAMGLSEGRVGQIKSELIAEEVITQIETGEEQFDPSKCDQFFQKITQSPLSSSAAPILFVQKAANNLVVIIDSAGTVMVEDQQSKELFKGKIVLDYSRLQIHKTYDEKVIFPPQDVSLDPVLIYDPESREYSMIKEFTETFNVDVKTLELLCLDKVQSPITGSIQLLTKADAKKFCNNQKLIKYYTYDQDGELQRIVEVKVVKDSQGKIKKTDQPTQIYPNEKQPG